ncbi:MAG: hypothetical protein K5859_00870 [Atopobiaceae bacterium]|nr:hypothetical protein [Atopobiaceae bacterium]
MAKLGCPCGNQLWNGCDGDETEYDFVPFDVFEDNYDKRSFFDLRDEDEGCINIWKCDMCDRLMVFDTEPSVTRYMKRICVDDLPENLLDLSCTEGYIYNNLFFKAVDEHYTREWERSGRAFNYTWSYLCPQRIKEEVFSGKNGRYRDWWYCRNYADYIVFYGTREMDVPLKAWMRYEQIWEDEE